MVRQSGNRQAHGLPRGDRTLAGAGDVHLAGGGHLALPHELRAFQPGLAYFLHDDGQMIEGHREDLLDLRDPVKNREGVGHLHERRTRSKWPFDDDARRSR